MASLTDRTFRQLHDEILRGIRRPGEILYEAELAERMGVSKTPVREALGRLSYEGWVVVLPRRGYIVRPMELSDVRDIFSARQLIEPALAAKAAAAPRTAARTEELEAIYLRQSDGDSDVALGAARDFHLAIGHLAGGGRIIRILEGLVEEVQRLHYLVPGASPHLTSPDELTAHRALADAIADGDSVRAERIMREHLEEVARALVHGFSGI